MTISDSSIVVAVKSQVSCGLDAETVILHLDRSVYFGLNEVGTIVWNQIQNPCTIREIRDAVVSEYEVSEDRCEQDVRELLAELLKQGLIEVRDATAS